MEKVQYVGVDNKVVNASIALTESFLRRVVKDPELAKNHITFTWHFIGSASHHFVTMRVEDNPHFDLDCNITLTYNGEILEENKTRELFIRAFNNHRKKSFLRVSNGKRVLTIKSNVGKYPFSVDFGLYNNQATKGVETFSMLVKNPDTGKYTWQNQKQKKEETLKRQDFCFDNGHYDEAFAYYLKKKNEFGDSKESREIYVDTLNYIWQKYHPTPAKKK